MLKIINLVQQREHYDFWRIRQISVEILQGLEKNINFVSIPKSVGTHDRGVASYDQN